MRSRLYEVSSSGGIPAGSADVMYASMTCVGAALAPSELCHAAIPKANPDADIRRKIHNTATQSISTSNGPGQDGTCTKIRAGNSSKEHTPELQSRFGISYPDFCLKKK